MSARPLRIGLSARLLHTPPKELGFPGKTLQYLEQSVAHWILAHGALALMIPTLGETAQVSRGDLSIRDVVGALDGLVLQGGADVCPQSYGQRPLRPEWSGDRVRDRFEIDLIWEFVFQGKPVLGICRGAQLINVACGGTLYQDIATQVPGAGRHRDDVLYDDFQHAIKIVANSRLARLFAGRPKLRVNSIHHQAIDRLGADLEIEARASADGIVEAIRWRGGSYMFGCQWHPEFQNEAPTLLDSGLLMRDFLDAATTRQRRGRHRRQAPPDGHEPPPIAPARPAAL